MKAANKSEAPAAAAAAAAEVSRAELDAEFRPDDENLCHAATKIQASFRGHQVRKQTERDRQDREDIEKIDLTDPDLNKAANKIQASFRTRKDNAN